ncbi:hypothetical protein [Verrucosispora sp. NA02020]|uniref:hypothetical protein n=1 Tax=Verrucosispora sp. NA02020 TaxID=2742132 RepID=UPI0015902F64|nr:hypothetical protein [Verrucosispora sp. NA02020]QKW15129.1 hypothetical protein HUT12_21750 [Verrucosispora sp. NA02020]
MLTSAATSRSATRWSRTVAAGHDAVTRDDAEFDRQFTHETADVDGVKMHDVTGGTGEPLVLLHGGPQSGYSWREIMPTLVTTELVTFFADGADR